MPCFQEFSKRHVLSGMWCSFTLFPAFSYFMMKKWGYKMGYRAKAVEYGLELLMLDPAQACCDILHATGTGFLPVPVALNIFVCQLS